MAFLHERLDPEISRGMVASREVGGVNIVRMRNGFERRRILHSNPLRTYVVSFSERPKELADAIRDFYLRVGGQRDGFLMKDWDDFEVENEELVRVGTEGNESYWQIVKRYGPVVRKILKPVRGTVTVPSGQGFAGDDAVDYTTGIVTLGSRSDTATGITVSCEFDVPVRFNDNSLDTTINYIENALIESVELIELGEAAL